jgi:hypothetical protein
MVGMHLPWGKIAIGGLVAIAAFGGALWASQWLLEGASRFAVALVYDSHTLGVVIEDTERLTGCEIERAYVDKGYRGHRAHLGRCHLKGRQGDAANVILTAVGHNLRLVLAWLSALCRLIVLALLQAFATPSALRSAS